MVNSSVIPILLSTLLSVVQGSGYYPSQGGPWSRYTTTQPPPTASGAVPGFNLPATTSAPPPEVTFVPRPDLNNNNRNTGNNIGNGEEGNFGTGGSSGSYGQYPSSSPALSNYFVITDPVTGEEFYMSKQSFWDIFHNRGVQTGSPSQSGISERSGGRVSSRGRVNYQQMQNYDPFRRARRAVLENEFRHVDQLSDDSEEGPIPESYEFYNQQAPMEELGRYQDQSWNSAGTQEYSEEAQKEMSRGLFRMFFPQMYQNTADQMIYKYTSFRKPQFFENPSTTTTSSTTTTPVPTSTTEIMTSTSTAVPVVTSSEKTEQADVVEITDAPTTTTVPSEENSTPDSNIAQPPPSK